MTNHYDEALAANERGDVYDAHLHALLNIGKLLERLVPPDVQYAVNCEDGSLRSVDVPEAVVRLARLKDLEARSYRRTMGR